ncbi:MAG: 3-deoxy-D-manno-octulosonic acid transferase [Deltaproteobacteria bacterium]|nr:3-deoxy-D-manno-octulosonic acid transferase [Deltaproteobacteria bacterium]
MFWSGVYNAFLLAAALPGVTYYGLKMLLTGKYRRSLGPKFGQVSPALREKLKAEGRPRIWVHAVSVGEVTAAAPILAALRVRFPQALLVLSTSTETGQEMAKRLATAADCLIYYPLDLPRVVRKVVNLVAPDLFCLVETELWPNFLRICREQGAAVVMVNGRLSPRSFSRYRATRFFWKGVLTDIETAGMISRTDAEKLADLGMDPGRIQVLGNAKYDGLASRVSPELAKETALRLGIGPEEPVFVAGSTHEGEEAAVLSVYGRLLQERPDFRLILVPRHIERAPAVAELVRQAGFADCLRMSEILAGRKPAGERIILVDVIGELFKVYSLATIVFCGGSLVPKGGQNLLEAAAWGKVVLHGPHMEDFRDEQALLAEAGAGIPVRDGDELYEKVQELLADPARLAQLGEAGRLVVAKNRGAAHRYAALIADVLRRNQCDCAIKAPT